MPDHAERGGRARRGRGWLSGLDQMPDEAQEDIARALAQLARRERTQEAIREELNLRLLALGIEPVSRSSFNRKAMQFALQARQIEETREVAGILAERMDAQPEGDIGLLLGELIKSLTYDVVSGSMLEEDGPSIELLRRCSDTVLKLERARRVNVETGLRLRAQFAKEAVEAVDEAGRKAGLTPENLQIIREQVYGIMQK